MLIDAKYGWIHICVVNYKLSTQTIVQGHYLVWWLLSLFTTTISSDGRHGAVHCSFFCCELSWCITVNMRCLLNWILYGFGIGFLWLMYTHYIYQYVHYMLKFCWWKWECYILHAFIHIIFRVRIIAMYRVGEKSPYTQTIHTSDSI